jgi:hypothetical protein
MSRSPSKGTSNLPDEDSDMDIFNDSGKTVRSISMTKSSPLITACAD